MRNILKQFKDTADNNFEQMKEKLMTIAYIIKAIAVVNAYCHLSVERRWNNLLHFHWSTKHKINVTQCVQTTELMEVEGYNIEYKFERKSNNNTYVYKPQIYETIVNPKGLVKKNQVSINYLQNVEHDFLIYSSEEEKEEKKKIK